MYYKRYLQSLRAWGIFKKMRDEEDRCIVSNVEEIDCDRILAELGAIIKPIKGASMYSLTLFKDGWAVFLISQELPGGKLMIRGGMITDEMVTLLTELKKAELPEGWNFLEIPEYGQ